MADQDGADAIVLVVGQRGEEVTDAGPTVMVCRTPECLDERARARRFVVRP